MTSRRRKLKNAIARDNVDRKPITNPLPAVSEIRHRPDASGTVMALKELGYSFSQAIADLVDNSVDAGAGTILIRFNRDKTHLLSISICDDGAGMSEEALSDAMTLGRRSKKTAGRLGKYGMGLKTASFSQADSLTVLTSSGTAGAAHGQRWTIENMKADWLCEVLSPESVAAVLKGFDGPVSMSPTGTMVFLERLNEFRVAPGYVDGKVEELIAQLQKHLGLHFHRFIDRNDLTLKVDTYRVDTGRTGPPHRVESLNPFNYRASGSTGYPQVFRLGAPLDNTIVDAHIWPPNTGLPGYRLGGGAVAERQGFYFYRNNRLIQAGGWNGIRSDSEPHLSLARARVDLSSSLDDMFSLSLQKTSVEVPDAFVEQLDRCKSEKGATFRSYLRTAERTYRAKPGDNQMVPVVPGEGLPADLRRKARETLAPNGQRVSQVRFEWADLGTDRFYEIDAKGDGILINSRLRSTIAGTGRKSRTDAPLLKTMLFLLIGDDIDRARRSAKHDKRTQRYQDLLLSAVEAEQRKRAP